MVKEPRLWLFTEIGVVPCPSDTACLRSLQYASPWACKRGETKVTSYDVVPEQQTILPAVICLSVGREVVKKGIPSLWRDFFSLMSPRFGSVRVWQGWVKFGCWIWTPLNGPCGHILEKMSALYPHPFAYMAGNYQPCKWKDQAMSVVGKDAAGMGTHCFCSNRWQQGTVTFTNVKHPKLLAFGWTSEFSVISPTWTF